MNTPAQGEVEVTLPRSTARRGRPRGVPAEVPRLRQEVDHLRREVAQLRRNNADTPSVATRGNATPILPAPDLAQLKERIEQLEKDLRDTRNSRNSSLSKCDKLEAKCKAQHDELENLRNRERDLKHADQARDKQMAHTQRQHSQVANKVTEIESSLAKANAEKVRLRKNVKDSKAAAAAAAALQAQSDVEMQVTLEIKAVKNDTRALQKRLARAEDSRPLRRRRRSSARAASPSSTRRPRRRGGRPLRGTAKCGAKCSTGTSASTGSSPR